MDEELKFLRQFFTDNFSLKDVWNTCYDLVRCENFTPEQAIFIVTNGETVAYARKIGIITDDWLAKLLANLKTIKQ